MTTTNAQLKMMIDRFLLWEIDALRPALGPSRSEVVTFILRQWLTEHGEQARQHVEHVTKLMAADRSTRRPT